MPAVLIECGFLSNAEECTRLSNEEYRRELAAVLVGALVAHMEELSSADSDRS